MIGLGLHVKYFSLLLFGLGRLTTGAIGTTGKVCSLLQYYEKGIVMTMTISG